MVTDKTILIDDFYLRSLKPEDVGVDYLSWFEDEKAKMFIEYARQKNYLNDLICYVQDKNDAPNALLLGIFDKNNDCHIGNIKYEPIDFQRKTAAMGILIGKKEFRGQGLAQCIIKESANWLNKTYGIKNIELGVKSENEIAISAYKKIGFTVAKIIENKNETSNIIMILRVDH